MSNSEFARKILNSHFRPKRHFSLRFDSLRSRVDLFNFCWLFWLIFQVVLKSSSLEESSSYQMSIGRPDSPDWTPKLSLLVETHARISTRLCLLQVKGIFDKRRMNKLHSICRDRDCLRQMLHWNYRFTIYEFYTENPRLLVRIGLIQTLWTQYGLGFFWYSSLNLRAQVDLFCIEALVTGKLWFTEIRAH